MASCSNCYYRMTGRQSPTGQPWCGWMGGNPTPDNPDRCNHVPLEQNQVPSGLVIARSSRVVSESELVAENAAHSDAAGGGSWQGY